MFGNEFHASHRRSDGATSRPTVVWWNKTDGITEYLSNQPADFL
jgi:hypothetical protein